MRIPPPGRGTRTRPAALLLLLAAAPSLLLGVSAETAEARARDTRLVLGIGVMPQLEQFVGDRSLPAELYHVEFLRPIGPRWRAGVALAFRGDFLIAGAAAHIDFWQTRRNEWRFALGAGYTIPLAGSEMVFRRYGGDGSELLDRLHARVGLGQTFDLDRGGLALRVAYDARVMLPGALLSVLEGLDDGVNESDTFAVHELVAAVELRFGRRR